MRKKDQKRDLTKRQQQMLNVIRSNSILCGPTIRFLGDAMKIKSTNGVVCHLQALEKKGYIRRKKKLARGIEVVLQ